MPRKYQSTEIFVKPDAQYKSLQVAKFVNTVMSAGKKSVATKLVYDSMDMLKQRFPEKPPLEVFGEAVNNVRPRLEVKSRRVGGANYQVPVEVNNRRQQFLAFKWILAAARARKGKPFADRLADELSDAYKREGAAMKKREETHRMAEANRAFAHFAW